MSLTIESEIEARVAAHKAEIAETRELIQALGTFVSNYCLLHARTSYAPQVNRAAKVVREKLSEALREL